MASSKTSQPAPPAQSSKMPDMEIPRDQDVVKRVSSPMATVSSHLDPYPHYIMSGACKCWYASVALPFLRLFRDAALL